MAMMAITTSSSMRVKPLCQELPLAILVATAELRSRIAGPSEWLFGLPVLLRQFLFDDKRAFHGTRKFLRCTGWDERPVPAPDRKHGPNEFASRLGLNE